MNERKKCKMELIIERINFKYESSDDDRNGIKSYVEGILDFGTDELKTVRHRQFENVVTA
jgi:hypothetical protein